MARGKMVKLPEGVTATQSAKAVLTMMVALEALDLESLPKGHYRCRPVGWAFVSGADAGTWAWYLDSPSPSRGEVCGGQHRVKTLWDSFKEHGTTGISAYTHQWGSTSLCLEAPASRWADEEKEK